MLYLKSFTFNPFEENTYVLYDENSEAFIFDPGNYTSTEGEALKTFIAEKGLYPKRLLLTHAHIDHVLGCRFVFDNYGLLPEVHKSDLPVLQRMSESAMRFGMSCEAAPLPEKYIEDGEVIMLGSYALECIFVPGHSPGSIAFYNRTNKFVIGGDVLFNGSIGRTDLPGGDHATLISSIKNRLFALNDDVKVFCGHGPSTTVGHERQTNPFVR